MTSFENIFKALGEPTRMRIVKLMVSVDRVCVCELQEIMNISQPRISQHLKILKQANLVTEQREGQRRVCTFNREYFNEIISQFNQFLDTSLDELNDYESEAIKIKDLSLGTNCTN
ncbi:Transcriptional regulator, ArsR family [Candidatus Syntrophocurvum alkaliphilum]|uniref:Transcriptional regulator, ArsR family n=1 Tax=Candidatus Syntrophocurvum alkaliphilum TaxID=2293317 RepID=A0A6I6DKH8_9FIRM|nr:metalloregulator ArsR/SmtB family transcription factor [Candidatus Syntrophocurvum alkaliphilum]QGU00075.1 Transcriptional regulator, ArsR family [Candidatus Syntrophocurvum alkaliphilum]